MKRTVLLVPAILALLILYAHGDVTLTQENKENGVCYRLDNGRVSLVVDPSQGGAVVSYKDRLGGDVELIPDRAPRGLCCDHFRSQGWPGEMFYAKYEVAGRKNDPKIAVLTLRYRVAGKWGDKTDEKIRGLVLEKTYTLHSDSPVLECRLKFTAPEQESKSFAYWQQHLFFAGGQYDKLADRSFRPSARGVRVEAGGEWGPTGPEDFLRDMTAGWMALLDVKRKSGLAVLSERDKLEVLYVCGGNQTLETMYRPVQLPAGRSVEYTTRIVPVVSREAAKSEIASGIFEDYFDPKSMPALEPPEFVPGSWTLVVLPDTQYYSEKYPGLFTLQTHWIARNRDKYNIRYVLHVGDVTNGNTDGEWRRAQEAMEELDGRVPYAIAYGNHDYTSYKDMEVGKSFLSRYFPITKFRDWPSFGGTMDGDTANTYHLFSAGGGDWIILALEWAPRDKAVRWANEILSKYPDRKAILLTHAYLYLDNTRYDYAKKGTAQGCDPRTLSPDRNGDVNDGEALWQKLVRKNNFVLTINGHLGGTGVVSDINERGRRTWQMEVDYQDRNLGGEGYLRILEFRPDGRTVQAKTYSPLYDTYLQDAGNQFIFELDP